LQPDQQQKFILTRNALSSIWKVRGEKPQLRREIPHRLKQEAYTLERLTKEETRNSDRGIDVCDNAVWGLKGNQERGGGRASLFAQEPEARPGKSEVIMFANQPKDDDEVVLVAELELTASDVRERSQS
jgi:hypothetical protein